MPQLSIAGMRDEAFPAEGYHALLDAVHADEDGAWLTMEGTEHILNSGAHVLSLYYWEQHGNIGWFIVETETDDDTSTVKYLDWRTLTLVDIVVRQRSPSSPVGSMYYAIGRWLYIITPGDAPVRWDGRRLESVGLVAPAAPVVSGPDSGFDFFDAAGGAMSVDPWRLNPATRAYSYGGELGAQRGIGPDPEAYDVTDASARVPVGAKWRVSYAVTWINRVGSESPPSPLATVAGINESGIDQGKRGVQVEIPPGPPGALAGRLWRTPNTEGIFDPSAVPLYLVDEFGHAAGHTYIDITPDGELYVLLDQGLLGTAPLSCPAGAFWGGYHWLVDGLDPRRVWKSAPVFYEQFPGDSDFVVGTSGQVVQLVPWQRSMVVLTTSGIYAFTSPTEPPVVLSDSHGTTAPRAAVAVPDQGVYFLDTLRGPCLITGTLQDEQSTAVHPLPGIRKTWKKRASTNLSAARVLYDRSTREVWWSMPIGGNVLNGMSIVWHIEREGWSLREGWSVDAMVQVPDGRVFVATPPDGAKAQGIDILTYAEPSRISTEDEVELTLHTRWLETPTQQWCRSVELLVEDRGTTDVQVSMRYDRRPEDLDQTEHGKDRVHADHDRDMWGTDVWSTTEEWVESEPSRLVVDLFGRAYAYSHQARISGPRMKVWVLNLLMEDEQAAPFRRERPGEQLP